MDNQIDVDLTIAFKEISKKSSWYAWLIRFWTRSRYYHTEIIVCDKWVSSMEGKGVTVNDLLPLKDSWKYLKIPAFKIDADTDSEIKRWILAQRGKEYDWKGIFLTQIFPFDKHDKNKWFCSEFVTRILQLYGVSEVSGIKPHTVSPGRLARLFNFNRR